MVYREGDIVISKKDFTINLGNTLVDIRKNDYFIVMYINTNGWNQLFYYRNEFEISKRGFNINIRKEFMDRFISYKNYNRLEKLKKIKNV